MNEILRTMTVVWIVVTILLSFTAETAMVVWGINIIIFTIIGLVLWIKFKISGCCSRRNDLFADW